MPEKEKGRVVKSQSERGLSELGEKGCGENVLERQVEGLDSGPVTLVTHNKSSTLPGGQRSGGGLVYETRKAYSNSLKRSITLPKNPFAGPKKGKKLRKDLKAMSKLSDSDKDSSDKDSLRISSEPNSPKMHSKMAKTNSVKNFFSKVVSQIAVNSRQRAKTDSSAIEGRTKEWKNYFEGGKKVPGVVGIRNHGNTCFINSILQCLSYTDILAEYFVLDQYKSDLRRRRRLNAFTKAAAGTGKGEVTEQLAMLLKSLWSLQYDPEISDKFKSLVDKYGSQYKGGSQHDAQEFLLWLLDRVHEDLNTATKKKYKHIKSSSGRPDDVVAAESLANYTRCNNSFVVDIFQAQFRSSLTCPSCERQSNTFDPFLCVSLPIPQKQVRPIVVTILYIDQSPRQVRIGLTLPQDADVKELRESLSKDAGIETDQLLLAEIDGLCFQKTFSDSQPLSAIPDKCPLYGIETPKPSPSEDLGAYIVLTWVNVLKEGEKIEQRFGSPYTIQVARETLYQDLQKLLMKEMSPILHDDILISAQKVPLFRIRVLDGFSEPAYLDAKVEMPLYMECVETAINMCSVQGAGGPAHVRLVAEWDNPAKTQVIADDTDPIEEHASVKQVQTAPPESSSVTLQECFSLYTSAERLGQDDAFFCPQCNKKQEVVKKLGVWSVPDVLVVHLKRFRQSTRITNKLSTMVEFPMESFDMSPNMARPPLDAATAPEAATVTSNGLKVLSAFSPWKHPKRLRGFGDENDCMYDLYAVCNHHGADLQGGHYTATCRNQTDGLWYTFDDVNTQQTPEEAVVTNDAYILFYQKSITSSGSTTGSSSSSSSSSTTQQDHWAYRMPNFYYKSKTETKVAPSAASVRGKTKRNNSVKKVSVAATNGTKTVTASESNKSFERNSAKYATLPAKRASGIINCETEHYSDTEQGGNDESSDEEEEEEDDLKTEPNIKPPKAKPEE